MRPLTGYNVIEMAGLAPSPYCGMLLADFGADVVVVDRPTRGAPEIPHIMDRNPLDRGKRSIRVNLRDEAGRQIVRRMIAQGDVLLEPYRPGVMEALGLGPAEVFVWNPGMVYARLTGWGQTGPYANMAGHDIDYIAVSGALSLFRRKGEKPLPPCNLLGDFAGGGLLAAFGILLALIERSRSGKGQVVDAAMVDGASSLCTFLYGLMGHGLMRTEHGVNDLDGGAPYYQAYETADGKFMAVGALEERFYRVLLQRLGLDSEALPRQDDRSGWPLLQERFTAVFKTRTRDEWTAVFEGTDACVAPVLEPYEVGGHPHGGARGLLIERKGLVQPAPAPRLSRTPGAAGEHPGPRGSDTVEIMQGFGYTRSEIDALTREGVIE
ncbi:CaiB/BaiF CoA transferase family protein [Desulfatiglans anilini]|uniref:CaiB/BaiF CoA transferase family protein n=1 Tax=Desulfatiglans anilini TaxID=90728 RepID=UPI0003FAD317|nr:CaiB/BaiF CoA-transferase family protein [Desulfatiglans anilini]